MDTSLHPVPGHDGIFATRDGHVYSNRKGRLRELKGSLHGGYIRIRLGTIVKGLPDTSRLFVHEIVMLTFAGPRPSGMVTRHLNGNPLDNRVQNLSYGTVQENRDDAARHGTIPIGLANGRAYVPDAIVRAVVVEIRAGAQQRATCRKYGVHEGTASAWLSGRARSSALIGLVA